MGIAVACAALGLFYAIAGAWMLFSPQTFYEIAAFGPYNRHFIGDTGAVFLALGIALLRATPRPYPSRYVIDAALFASVIHLGNHLAEGFSQSLDWQTDLGLGAVLAVNLYASIWSRRGARLTRDLK